MGRLPKRTMLATMPPAPHLTGNVFAIDLAAVDRGWSMQPAAGIGAADGAAAAAPRKWAAMAEVASGATR